MKEEVVSNQENEITIRLTGVSALPLINGMVKAPDIDYIFVINLFKEKGQNKINYNLIGSAHDGFPAYEVFIGKQNVYFHTPKLEEGQSPFNINPFSLKQSLLSLFPPMEFDDIKESGEILLSQAYDKGFNPPTPTQAAESPHCISNCGSSSVPSPSSSHPIDQK
jgi:hypothetical protein